MLQYEQFERIIITEFGNDAMAWRHVLPAVPLAYRPRFLQTMRRGFTVTESFDMIMLSQTLNEEAFHEFVQQALVKKISHDKRGSAAAGSGDELYGIVI